MKNQQDHDAQFKLRLPSDLKARVEESAQANQRSMNAEIVVRLSRSYSMHLNPDHAMDLRNATPKEVDDVIQLARKLIESLGGKVVD